MNDKLLGMLGLAVRAGKVAFGVFLTQKAIDEGKAKLVICSNDTGKSNKRAIEAKCEAKNVPIIFYSDKHSLSHAAGKKDIPALCVCDENFKDAIMKIYGGVQ